MDKYTQETLQEVLLNILERQRQERVDKQSIILTELKTFDQKNRIHIKNQFLDILGIEYNSEVLVALDIKNQQVIIRKLTNEEREAIPESKPKK